MSTRRIDHTRTITRDRQATVHVVAPTAATRTPHRSRGIATHTFKETAMVDLKTVQAPVLAMAISKAKWLIHADTHALPHEDLPLPLPAGKTGADYGWPDKMMGAATFQMLADKRITKTSQLIQLAGCMTEDQFQAHFDGDRPCWAYLRRAAAVHTEEFWMRLALIFRLSQEDLPVHLRHGETGAHSDWPYLMMGESNFQM